MQPDRIEVKAAFEVDEAGLVTGKAWDFSSPDRVGDVITPDAFAKAVPPLPMLFAHDQSQVVGSWTGISAGADGLTVTGKLLVNDVARAAEVRAMLQAKAVTGLSVGFMTKKSAPRRGGGRTITDLDLVEVSIVAVPAHPGARITSHKDLPMTDVVTEGAVDTKAIEAITAKLTELETKADTTALAARLDKLEAKASRPSGGAVVEPAAEVKAFNTFARRGREHLAADEVKALTVSTDTAGGYLVPDLLASEILKNVVQYSPVRQLAQVVSLSVPEITYPTQTGATNATWVSEIAARTASQPSFGQLKVGVHELATYTDISVQLLEDNAFNLEALLATDLGEQFGKVEATAFVSGSGTGQPKGFLTGTDLERVPTAGTALTADDLIDFYHALASPYVGNAVWGMNRQTMAAVRKLKATDGHYLWSDSLAAGNPPTILGRPVYEFVDLPDVAADATPIVFGDFRAGYRVFDRVALSILRDPYSLATTGQVRFHARKRVGGAVVKAEALKLLEVAAA